MVLRVLYYFGIIYSIAYLLVESEHVYIYMILDLEGEVYSIRD
jgi:hypothetical protein